MKGLKKCFGVLLLLFTIFGLSLNVCFDTNALKHEYKGIPLLSPTFPNSFQQIEQDGLYYIDWTNSGSGFSDFYDFSSYNGFELWVDGDAYYSDIENIDWTNNISYASMFYNHESFKCQYNDFYSLANWYNSYNDEYKSFRVNFNSYYLDPRIQIQLANSAIYSNPLACRYHQAFSNDSIVKLDINSFNDGLLSSPNIGTETGFVQSFNSARSAYQAALSPYWYSYDGFYVHDTQVDSDSGIHYNHSFSFNDLFSKNIKQFSKLTIPLWTYDDYWTNPENFYAGRQIKWTGVFDFDKPVTINPDMPSGSYLRLSGYGFTQSQQFAETHIPCHFNYTEVVASDFYQLEYICEGSFVSSYIYWLPYLELYVPDSYVFTTEGNWRWASIYLTTDNDETPGQSFGGLTSAIGQAGSGSDSDSNIDWGSSLTFMFDDISVFNPFANIFSLFTNQSTCANIPTLAGMLHSNETQVCPWFSSATRAIVTPVLGLSSMMLLFGFVVRWLGARSGNFIEDSEGHDVGGLHFASKFRRKK